MNWKDMTLGKTGYTITAGCDAYPHTIIAATAPYGKRGRKPKGWVKGSWYVTLTIQSDELVWDKKPAKALGTCHADTGANGVWRNVWFVANTKGVNYNIEVIVQPDGEILDGRVGYRRYNRDSSF